MLETLLNRSVQQDLMLESINAQMTKIELSTKIELPTKIELSTAHAQISTAELPSTQHDQISMAELPSAEHAQSPQLDLSDHSLSDILGWNTPRKRSDFEKREENAKNKRAAMAEFKQRRRSRRVGEYIENKKNITNDMETPRRVPFFRRVLNLISTC